MWRHQISSDVTLKGEKLTPRVKFAQLQWLLIKLFDIVSLSKLLQLAPIRIKKVDIYSIFT